LGEKSCRAPRGARGLKPGQRRHFGIGSGRAPRGARGLKPTASSAVA
jgi:hypothetical protein